MAILAAVFFLRDLQDLTTVAIIVRMVVIPLVIASAPMLVLAKRANTIALVTQSRLVQRNDRLMEPILRNIVQRVAIPLVLPQILHFMVVRITPIDTYVTRLVRDTVRIVTTVVRGELVVVEFNRPLELMDTTGVQATVAGQPMIAIQIAITTIVFIVVTVPMLSHQVLVVPMVVLSIATTLPIANV